MVNVQILLRIDARFTPMLTAFRNTFGVAASSAGMPTDSSRCICILGSKLPTDRGGMGGVELNIPMQVYYCTSMPIILRGITDV